MKVIIRHKGAVANEGGTLAAEATELSMSLVTPALASAKVLYFQG